MALPLKFRMISVTHNMLYMYLKIYGEAARDYAIALVPGWITYNISIPIITFFAYIWKVDLDNNDIDLIAKVFGVLVGAVSSFFVVRHVRAQTKNVKIQTVNTEIDSLKKTEEVKKLKLENLRMEIELENERIIAEVALRRMKREEEGHDGEDQ